MLELDQCWIYKTDADIWFKKSNILCIYSLTCCLTAFASAEGMYLNREIAEFCRGHTMLCQHK